MRTRKFSIMMLCMLLAAGLLYGCGSSKKEGTASATSPETVGTAGADTVCEQCHSASVDPVLGVSIVAEYEMTSFHKGSTHLGTLNGCEACHGGGAEHFGVGPIPFPNPFDNNGTRCAFCHNGTHATNAPTKFADSKHANMTIEEGDPCRRCHTNEGAILGAFYGLTGPKDVLDNPVYQGAVPLQKEFTAFVCDTCHQHGGGLRTVKARDEAGNVVNWNPSGSNLVNDQFNLCTSCHNLKTYDGSKTMASGTAASGTVPVGHHENTWYRIIATTHLNNLDNPTNGITGYVIRSNGETACFDCHGHEARTETSNNTNASNFDPNKTTIYRDWALSGHAGRLLEAKYAAAGNNVRTVETVDAVMNAAAGQADPWSHYDWSGADRQACQMCHTSTGFSNYATDSVNYDPVNNDFSHLFDAATGRNWRTSSRAATQREMLYCWGCHRNTSSGLLRITNGQAQLSFTLNDQPIIIQNVGKSAVCVICHGGRGSVGAEVANDTRSSRFQGHHAPTAGIMFASQTHIAYEYAGKNYDNPAFQHYKINAATIGPCASCHMPVDGSGSPSHTFDPIEESGDTITKINNQALCNTCHGAGMTPAALEKASSGFEEASTILNNYNSNLAGFTNYLNLAITSDNYSDTVAVPNDAYGAWQNGKIVSDEPCAYVHNPTYAKRIVFDSIDWMDNGVLDGTISFDATAFPEAAAWFFKPGASGVTTFSRP
jgi:hypothetical protein